MDSNQGYNPYKWVICPLTRVINLHITSYLPYPEPLSKELSTQLYSSDAANVWMCLGGSLTNTDPHVRYSPGCLAQGIIYDNSQAQGIFEGKKILGGFEALTWMCFCWVIFL